MRGRERKNVTCSDGEGVLEVWEGECGGVGGLKNVSEAGAVLRKVRVSGWKGERGMPGRVTVAILSTACVLTLSPVSH